MCIRDSHYTKEKGLDFVDTLTSPKAVKLAGRIPLDYIKVASRDLTHIPLLKAIAETKLPVILSTGMGTLKEIDAAVELITKQHDNIVILHCISQYPADYPNLNLKSIPFLRERYPFRIGYSDHSIGIVAPILAVSLGAEFIEKHITLSRRMKGSDHAGALEPDGLWRMTRDIRNMEMAMGTLDKKVSKAVEPFKYKLERSVCILRKLRAGEPLTRDNLVMLSPGGGMRWEEAEALMGKTAARDIGALSPITEKDFT